MLIHLPPRAPRKRVETDIVKEIIAAISRIPGVRVSRNNVGTIEDSRGIPVSFGLGEGSPDIMGIITFGGVESTFMVLRNPPSIAVAFAIEVKQPKRYATRKQKAWHSVARRRGLRSCVARSDADAVAFVNELRNDLRQAIRDLGASL